MTSVLAVTLAVILAGPQGPPGTAVNGRVTDPRGAPLADVQVWTIARDGAQGQPAVTGTDGRFALAGLGFSHRIELCRPGYLSESPAFGEVADGAVEVVLAPAARVSGRVLDATGRPLAGAFVSVWVPDQVFVSTETQFEGPCPMRRTARSAVAGADGRFLVDHLEPGRYWLGAGAEGHLPVLRKELELAAGETSVEDLLLERGAVLRGRILGPDGTPQAGLRLHVRGGRSQSSERRSEADGSYVLTGIDPGLRELHVASEQGLTERHQVEVGPGENVLDLRYPTRSRPELRGRVVDGAGRPIGGARVRAQAPSTGVSEATSDPDGAFSLAVEDGLYELWAQAPGHGPASAQQPIEVRGASIDGLELVLLPGVTLRGRLAGAAPERLQHLFASAGQGKVHRTFEVDEEGRFAIVDLGPGVWRVGVGGRDFVAEGEARIEPGDHEVSLELAIQNVWQVEGRVLGPDGTRRRQAVIQVREQGQRQATRHLTREDGTFSLRLVEGTYLLVGSAPGFASVAADEPLRVEGAAITGLEIRVREAVPPLTGRIVGLEPADFPLVVVTARQGEIEHRTQVDRDVKFELLELGPGDWDISAQVGKRVARSRLVLGPQ